jgi:pentapeptide repeat protein
MTARAHLRADCARCAGLCCVAPALARSADFAIDKPAGVPCPHLREDFRCRIHERLRPEGFPGCAAYDCFGAGQRVVQETFRGRDWRRSPEIAGAMFAALGRVRALHELLWYLEEALTLRPAGPLRTELREARGRTERLAGSDPEGLAAIDLGGHARAVHALLARASAMARGGPPGPAFAGADLIGRDLRGTDLRGADLRGAYLIGADLRGADLAEADLQGADLRGADLRGADLSAARFLTRPQVDAARGDARTGLPPALGRPPHWATTGSGSRRRSAAPRPGRPPRADRRTR